MLSLASTAFGVIITPSSLNDGYYHDEFGTSYDFYSGTDTVIGAYYQMYNTGDTVIKHNAYIQFDISGLTEVVGKSTLNIYVTESHYDNAVNAGTIKVRTDSSTATGNASQRLGGDVTIHTMPEGVTGWLSLDVTTYVTNAFNNGYDYLCFSFDFTSGEYYGSSGFSFYSADSSINKPYLSVPEPSTYAAIAGAGSLGLAFLRRRRKAVL